MFTFASKPHLSASRPARSALVAPSPGPDFTSSRVTTPCLQCKLTVGAIDDPYEREADAAADRVMQMSESSAIGSSPPALQRKCTACEHEEDGTIQTKRTPSTGTGPALDVTSAVRAVDGGGETLPKPLRDFYEPRFGHDFSRVRVHADARAAEAARGVAARAFTVRNHIVFGRGEYSPETPGGRHLLAHELAHVLQQTGGSPAGAPSNRAALTQAPPLIQRFAGNTPPAAELAAKTVTKELAKKELEKKVAQSSLARAGWRQFWRVVVRRFALRGATAIALAAADGPLPFGDLVTLGLALWTVWDIIKLWDVLWREAETVTDQAPAPQPEATPAPAPAPAATPRPAAEAAPQPVGPPDVDFDEDRRFGCSAYAIAQRGGNSCHDQFATSVSGVTREWGVRAPDGAFASFDALSRHRTLYEIKTGYRFLLNTSPSTALLRQETIKRFVTQSEDQQHVANRCRYPLVWVFNDARVAEYVNGLIRPPVRSRSFPCDESR